MFPMKTYLIYLELLWVSALDEIDRAFCDFDLEEFRLFDLIYMEQILALTSLIIFSLCSILILKDSI